MIKPKYIFIIITILIILALITAFSLGFFGSKDNSTVDHVEVQQLWQKFTNKGRKYMMDDHEFMHISETTKALGMNEFARFYLPVIIGLVQHVAETLPRPTVGPHTAITSGPMAPPLAPNRLQEIYAAK